MTGRFDALEASPGSDAEREAFRALQASLPGMFARLIPDRLAPRTIVVLPSLSLDAEVMARIKGVHHYEERMLGMLTLLRLPRARVIYLTSRPIPETVIDYYLHFLQGVPSAHARARLRLLCCHDGSLRPLTEKVLERPRLLARLREAVGDPSSAHIAPYAVTPLERTLAVRLGLPVNGCDPDLSALGSKSGGRKIMREAGLAVPDGAEDLADEAQVAQALAALKRRRPSLRRAVVKLNEGFSGEGNALFSFEGAPSDETLDGWVEARLENLAFEAPGMTFADFGAKIREMGAVVEAFLDGEGKTSPSAQFRVDPSGAPSCVSTHDQMLGGPSGQVFLGCSFPADGAYRALVAAEGGKVARLLARRGVIGRFGVDFLCLREEGEWRAYAIEINLRKGGATHPFLMLEFLTDGALERGSGLFLTPLGHPRYYVASDNLESERYRGLTPQDLVDLVVLEGLHFDGSVQEGVVFHLIGALSEFGKLGVVCVGASPERAQALYERTKTILDGAQQDCAAAGVCPCAPEPS
ncbi:peptide ligase PGM1-related protein [Methylocella sp.]|uniref:peptide ligase PGM1-related protein n=1 Tax=Methylocella sp. TaxID=1978226 RepID=UPI003783B08B